jgi:subtilisin family serine protease
LLDQPTHAHRSRRVAAVLAVLLLAVPFFAGRSAGAPSPVAVVTDFPVHAEFRPDDPGYLDQWGLRQVVEDPNPPPPPTPPPNAWDVTPGSRSVVVAVVDTGVLWTHPDLLANMWSNTDGTHGKDFIDGDLNPMDPDPTPLFHGTGVAGVIAAILNNGQGVAGTAQVSVMALRALGTNGQGTSLNTSEAIRWAVNHGARVINLSLGTNDTSLGPAPTDIQLAVDYAWRRGALIVAAAGNAGVASLDYPARLPNVVSVAATDETGRRASFSNYGSGLDISAPGNRILTLDGNNNVHYTFGTSFAAPFVTGVASLLLSMDENLTNVELWNILNTTAVQPGGGSGPNSNFGWGVVNAWNALNALSRPFISVNAYPTSVSRTSTFGVTWSIRGPVGGIVTDTHVIWGTSPTALGNATTVQTGATRQSFTANGLSIPSGADTFYFRVVATVNGTTYTSQCAGPSGDCFVAASNLPDFLFVLYQLLASNLLFLALFILALAAIVAFIPQRRAARARRYAYPPKTMYPAGYYVGSPGPPQPPPAPVRPRAVTPAPPIEFVRQPTSPATPTAIGPPGTTVTRPIAAKKRCPSCGTMVASENLFCFFCGNPFH